MKTLFFQLCFCLFSIPLLQVQATVLDLTDTISDLKIEQQQIIYQKKILGNIKRVKTESSSSTSNNYKVQIFEKKGRLVAEYEMEVLDKAKKNQDDILSAQIKTVKDNVVHNGNNFIDFHLKPSNRREDAILQLESVVKYLLSYNYL